MVASRYPNLAQTLWGLPGGRRRNEETFEQAAIREAYEETGLAMTIDSLAYVSESFDRSGHVHVLNITFLATGSGAIAAQRDAHVIEAAWVPRAEVTDRIGVAVVREPLAAHLRGDRKRYYRFADSGISIEFADEA